MNDYAHDALEALVCLCQPSAWQCGSTATIFDTDRPLIAWSRLKTALFQHSTKFYSHS
jgi:hypothetical protein